MKPLATLAAWRSTTHLHTWITGSLRTALLPPSLLPSGSFQHRRQTGSSQKEFSSDHRSSVLNTLRESPLSQGKTQHPLPFYLSASFPSLSLPLLQPYLPLLVPGPSSHLKIYPLMQSSSQNKRKCLARNDGRIRNKQCTGFESKES